MKKLNLNKKVISKLSDLDQQQVKGGVAAYTTTFSVCTLFLCCGQGCEQTNQNTPNCGYTLSGSQCVC